MARPKTTPEDIEKRKKIAKEWADFRYGHLFTQKKLAEILGISRRTVQMIEAGQVTPHGNTAKQFTDLVDRHRANKGAA